MSRAVASDRRRVTACQWRSMKTKATTPSSTTIGAMMMMQRAGVEALGQRAPPTAAAWRARESSAAAARSRSAPCLRVDAGQLQRQLVRVAATHAVTCTNALGCRLCELNRPQSV